MSSDVESNLCICGLFCEDLNHSKDVPACVYSLIVFLGSNFTSTIDALFII